MEPHGGAGSLERTVWWRGAAIVDGTGRGAVRVLELLLRWQETASQRRHLSELDDRILRNLGLSRADVAHEVRRPFWDDGGRPWWPRH